MLNIITQIKSIIQLCIFLSVVVLRRVTKTWGQHYSGMKIISCYTLAIINGVQRVSIKYDLAGSVRREREQMVNGTIRLFDTNRIYRDWN